MKLCELLYGLKYKLFGVSKNAEVSNISSDSRKITCGCLFVCIKGSRRDGHQYACEAVAKGALAAVAERYVEGVPTVVVEDTRYTEALMWFRLCGMPYEDMKLCAVTGTNGKTSTAVFLGAALNAAGIKTAVIGTLGCEFEGNTRQIEYSSVSDAPASMTTPDPQVLYPLLRNLRSKGCKAVVMEVSSHAVALKKTAPLTFDCGVFTNLSPEHLDFHFSMENYYKTKASLFRQCRMAIVNVDDGYGRRLSCSLGEKAFGVSSEMAKRLSVNENGIEYYTRLYKSRNMTHIKTKALGFYNVYNTLLAANAAAALGADESAVSGGISHIGFVDGRLEKVLSQEGFDVYIDYAHTPDAVRATLCSVRAIAQNRRIVALFGCGGDRDKSKRAVMGALAESLADKVIVTSDNPRSEKKSQIIADILRGIKNGEKTVVIEDRRKAIEYAVETAEKGDVIVCLGKGHESYETDGEGKHPFSEKKIIAEAMSKRKKS